MIPCGAVRCEAQRTSELRRCLMLNLFVILISIERICKKLRGKRTLHCRSLSLPLPFKMEAPCYTSPTKKLLKVVIPGGKLSGRVGNE